MKRKPKEIIEELIEALPDWGKDQRFTILLGMELYASHTPFGEIFVKEIRCEMCGQCCMDLIPNHKTMTPWGVDDEGKCNALRKNRNGHWICDPPGGKTLKPYACLQDPLKSNTPECIIRYE